MSKPQKGLSYSKKNIRRYVQHLGAMSYVEKVYLVGSRSPLSSKTPKRNSDWDLMIRKSKDGHITKPRKYPYNLLADLMPYTTRSDMIEIWPNDEGNILNV